MNDRELLHCDNCGLLEDMDISGRLITYKSGDPVSDSELRRVKEIHMCALHAGHLSVQDEYCLKVIFYVD